jgi:hypothetical protein
MCGIWVRFGESFMGIWITIKGGREGYPFERTLIYQRENMHSCYFRPPRNLYSVLCISLPMETNI